MKYTEKLQDPRWQKKRLKVFERDGWKCTQCGNEKLTLHVNHLKYNNNPWKTRMKYLKTLCKNCHQLEYEVEKQSKYRRIRHYGYNGIYPDNYYECPCAKKDSIFQSCRSSSGDSFCLGYQGTNEENTHVRCWW